RAADYLLNEMRPLNQAVLQAAGELILHQEQMMELAKAEAGAIARKGTHLVLLLGIIALGLAAAVAYWITRSITTPIAEAVAAANALAAGDLGVRIEARSQDEAGQLLSAMGAMV